MKWLDDLKAKVKLKREHKTERELFRVLSDYEWWFVLDMSAAGDFGFWGIGYIYPMLVRFEAQGLVESHWNEDVHPRRREYRMIPKKSWEN